MGGFFLIFAKDRGRHSRALQIARQQFEHSGLGRPVSLRGARGLHTLDLYPKHNRAVPPLIRFGDDFIASVGTLLFRDKIGTEALAPLYETADALAALDECRGHFAVIIRKGGRTTLLRDKLGSYEIYVDRDLGMVSTSFLAIARNLPRRTPSPSECIEYVVNGVTFGTATPIAEIRRLDLSEGMHFDPVPQIVRSAPVRCPDSSEETRDALIAANTAALVDHTAVLARVFDGRINLGFSGGYDSRLLLALFRRNGVRPCLFVYGRSGDRDVALARHIAESENIPLQHVDKAQTHEVTPDNLGEVLRRNYDVGDGFPQEGIFEPGHEYVARIERSSRDVLVINGGAGEIFRNFFKCRDSPMSVRGFVRMFLGQFNPAILASTSLLRDYENGLARKIVSLLGLREPRLARRQVECLYPHLRCRSWMGREHSINNRFGHVALPFYDQRIVEGAMQIPIRYKHFGNFESAMIRGLDPALSKYPSSSGFPLDRDTPIRGMLPDLLLYAPPPEFRRYNYRIKRLLAKPAPRPWLLAEPAIGAVIDGGFPYMSRLFKLDAIQDHVQFARACTLEYMFQALDADESNLTQDREPVPAGSR